MGGFVNINMPLLSIFKILHDFWTNCYKICYKNKMLLKNKTTKQQQKNQTTKYSQNLEFPADL